MIFPARFSGREALIACVCVLAAFDASATVTHHPVHHHPVKHAVHALRHIGGGAAVAHAQHIPTVPARPQPLNVRANVAYVIDQDSNQVLVGKNADEVRPIASITKLMTGVIVSDAQLPMDEKITITEDDVDTLKNSSSHLRVGTVLTREQALHLALMASENRAAHALARTYPGGVAAFVSAMNNKAQELGMAQTHYVEPTGLSYQNQSTARDLAVLAKAAYERPLVREFTTDPDYALPVGRRAVSFRNTDRLVRSRDWHIDLQKTGFINEAGQCLLLKTRMAGHKLIMVFLDSFNRIRDAESVRRWLATHPEFASHVPQANVKG